MRLKSAVNELEQNKYDGKKKATTDDINTNYGILYLNIQCNHVRLFYALINKKRYYLILDKRF